MCYSIGIRLSVKPMKFLCTHQDLMRGLGVVYRAVAVGRKASSIESYILMQVSDKGLLLTAFNGTLGMETLIPATVYEPGASTIKAKTFHDWVSKLDRQWSVLVEKKEKLEKMRVDDQMIDMNMLKCSAGVLEEIEQVLEGTKKRSRAFSEFNGMLVDSFPDLPIAEASFFMASAAMLIEGIGYCKKFIGSSQREARHPALVGIHMRIKNDLLEFISTDGHRGAVYRSDEVSVANLGITVPGVALEEIRPLLSDAKLASFSLSLGGSPGNYNALVIEPPQDAELTEPGSKGKIWWRASLRLLGSNPPYPTVFVDDERSMPTKFSSRAILPVSEFKSSLERVKVFVDELGGAGAGCVFLEFSLQNRLLISGDISASGGSKEEVEIQYSGVPAMIYLDGQYVLDILSLISTKSILVQFNDPLRPIVFRPYGGEAERVPNITLSVMPVRYQLRGVPKDINPDKNRV